MRSNHNDSMQNTSTIVNLRGTYRDVFRDAYGRLCFASEWNPNTIADRAWPLLTGLLKNDPNLNGILYFAVGSGDPDWDVNPIAPSPAATQLQNEIERQAVLAEAITYLDENDLPASVPTNRIEIRASFTWPDAGQTLREFGLFGGDATGTRNSGYLVNHVIHPRLYMESGTTIARQLRLSVRAEIDPEWLTLPQHWLRETSIKNVDGVGDAYVQTLSRAGITTVGQLAETEPLSLQVRIVPMKRVEMWAKARLSLRTAATLSPVAELLDRRAWEVIITSPATLAAAVGADEKAVARLREQLCALQLALDNRFLQEITVGRLAQPL